MKTAFGILLTDFATSSASVNNCSTTLTWTSKDLSKMKYEIERKLPGELIYTKIADVNGQGTSLAIHNYQYDDAIANSAAGTISYRIKQIIDTATATLTGVYVDTADVSLVNACAVEDKIIAYPNPADKHLTLSVTTKDAISKLSITVYDITGKMIYQSIQSKAAGKALFYIPVAKLLAGEYIIALLNDKKKIGTARFIKQ